MSDTQHGPVRRLVERAFGAVVDVEEIEKFSLTLEDMNAIRAEADALERLRAGGGDGESQTH